MAVTNFIWNELTDNIMFETDEDDAVTVSYTYLPEQFGELLSQKRNGVTSYYHYDGEHSTRQLTDENQNVTDTFIYTAFGEGVARTGVTTNPFGYKGAVGYYTNPTTDDIYVRARTYQPVTGRWLSMDPLGFVDGPNLYRAYFVPAGADPDGLWVTRRDCAKAVRRMYKKHKKWFDRFKALGCQLPTYSCKKPCAADEDTRFRCDLNDIIICYEKFDNISDLEKTFVHELVHAWDFNCLGNGCRNCRHIACSEIRAYSYSGQCEEGEIWRKGRSREECIKYWANESTKSQNCKNSDTLINDLYQKCVVCEICAGNPIPPDICWPSGMDHFPFEVLLYRLI